MANLGKDPPQGKWCLPPVSHSSLPKSSAQTQMESKERGCLPGLLLASYLPRFGGNATATTAPFGAFHLSFSLPTCDTEIKINSPKIICRFRFRSDTTWTDDLSHSCTHRYFTPNFTFAFAFVILKVINSELILFRFAVVSVSMVLVLQFTVTLWMFPFLLLLVGHGWHPMCLLITPCAL